MDARERDVATAPQARLGPGRSASLCRDGNSLRRRRGTARGRVSGRPARSKGRVPARLHRGRRVGAPAARGNAWPGLHPRSRCSSSTAAGISEARNVILAAARSPFICFLDDDETVHTGLGRGVSPRLGIGSRATRGRRRPHASRLERRSAAVAPRPPHRSSERAGPGRRASCPRSKAGRSASASIRLGRQHEHAQVGDRRSGRLRPGPWDAAGGAACTRRGGRAAGATRGSRPGGPVRAERPGLAPHPAGAIDRRLLPARDAAPCARGRQGAPRPSTGPGSRPEEQRPILRRSPSPQLVGASRRSARCVVWACAGRWGVEGAHG